MKIETDDFICVLSPGLEALNELDREQAQEENRQSFEEIIVQRGKSLLKHLDCDEGRRLKLYRHGHIQSEQFVSSMLVVQAMWSAELERWGFFMELPHEDGYWVNQLKNCEVNHN